MVAFVVLTLVWAGSVDYLLEMSLRQSKDVPLPVESMVLGSLVIWALLWTLYGLTGTLRWSLLALSVVAVALYSINAERVAVLNEPLLPSDVVFLAQPAFLLDMVGGARIAVLAVAGGVLVVGLLWWLQRRFGPARQRPAKGTSGRGAWWALRGVLVVGGVSLMLVASGFSHPDNQLRKLWDSTGPTWRPWAQLENYRANGFVGGALYNMPTTPMDAPPGYDEAAMREIAERWTARAAVTNRGTDPAVLGRTNVVVLLSESMGDPAALSTVRFPEDPIPNVHRLMAENTSGHAVAWDYGTGTSAMEFSALTGQSLGLFKPTVISPYQQFVSSQTDYPSAVGWMKSTGHRAVAIHPFQTYMYQRKSVYKMFGFDAFLDRDHVGKVTREQRMRYISDETAFNAVVKEIATSQDPVLTHLVTMQNHLPYGGQYRDPIVPTGVAPENARKLGQWARGMKITDDKIPGFLDALRATGEPTTVIWFGDHFPGVLGEATLAKEKLNAYRTPFFVWNSETKPAADPQGDVSPASFLPIALRQMGATLPPYLVLLNEVQAEIGEVRGDEVVSPTGETIALERLSPEQQELLADYRMVQYDFSVGKRYAQDELWYPRGRG